MVKARQQEPDADDLSDITIRGKAGDVIYEEGDAAAVMFVIEEGAVELRMHYAGEDRSMGVLEAGDFFGEMSLLEGQPREATATAKEDYKIISIDASTFDELIQVNPEIAVRMLRKLSRRLLKFHEAEARALEIARGALKPAVEAKKKTKTRAPARQEEPAKASLLHKPTGEVFDLKPSGITTIGRYDRSADIAPDVDFTAISADTIVSRRHARILKKDDGYYLEEVDKPPPPNGTYVNGRRLVKGERVRLNNGDIVAFGTLSTTFQS